MQAADARPELQVQQRAAQPALWAQEGPGRCWRRTLAADQAAAGECSTLRHMSAACHPAAAVPAGRHDTQPSATEALWQSLLACRVQHFSSPVNMARSWEICCGAGLRMHSSLPVATHLDLRGRCLGPAGTELHRMPCRARTEGLWPWAPVRALRPAAAGAAWQTLQDCVHCWLAHLVASTLIGASRDRSCCSSTHRALQPRQTLMHEMPSRFCRCTPSEANSAEAHFVMLCVGQGRTYSAHTWPMR